MRTYFLLILSYTSFFSAYKVPPIQVLNSLYFSNKKVNSFFPFSWHRCPVFSPLTVFQMAFLGFCLTLIVWASLKIALLTTSSSFFWGGVYVLLTMISMWAIFLYHNVFWKANVFNNVIYNFGSNILWQPPKGLVGFAIYCLLSDFSDQKL